MSDKKSATASSTAIATTPNKASTADLATTFAVGDDYIEVKTDRTVYSTEKCKDYVINGYLIDLIEVECGREKPAQAYVVRLIAPTMTVDRDGNLVKSMPGDDVLVFSTYHLDPFKALALDPERCHTMKMQPKKKIPIDGGQSLWTFHLGFGRVPRARSEVAPETLAKFSVPYPTQHQQLPATAGNNAHLPQPVPFG